MSMIVSVEEASVYTLVQKIVSGPPPQEHEQIITFLTDDEGEMEELWRIFVNGETDARIVQTAVPDHIWYADRVTVHWSTMTDPNGIDVMEWYRSLAVAHLETPS